LNEKEKKGSCGATQMHVYLEFHTQISSRICCTNACWLGETKGPCLRRQQRQSSSIQVSLNSPSFFLFGVGQVLVLVHIALTCCLLYKDHCPRQELEPSTQWKDRDQ